MLLSFKVKQLVSIITEYIFPFSFTAMKSLQRLLLPLLILCLKVTHAQAPFITSTKVGTTSTIKTVEGDWVFSLFANNVIKATFNPKNAIRNEQVSDAVIQKALAYTPTIVAEKNHATLSWNNKAFVEISGEGLAITPQRGKTVSLLQTFYNDSSRGFRFGLRRDEQIFGTGERSIPLNRRGYKLSLYNNPWYGYGLNADALNFSVPFLMSSNGYGIFFDNPSKGYFDIGKTNTNTLEYGVMSGELSFYVIGGDTYEKVLSNYQLLIGTQQLPPRWAMGNFMSRFGYTGEADVQQVYQQMKADNIPMDAVIFDLFWFGDSIKTTMGNLDWVNKKAWPAPKKMISDFKKDGVKTILIAEPFVLETTPNFTASKPFLATDKNGQPYILTDFYFGKGGLIDIFRKDAQQWFWGKYKSQMDNGVTGWWGDLGEPEKHPADLYHNLTDLGFKRKFAANEVHNLYGYYWSKMVYNNFAKLYPNERLFHLNRSGYPGSQRYGSFPWSGDVSRNWDGLKAQLPLMLGMSLSGVPYIHADAGGFAGGDHDSSLYVRWLQFAAFTPIFKPHGTMLGGIDPAATSYPSEPALWPEPTKRLARQAVLLRYSLLPYNYTLAYRQATQGKPLARPMLLERPFDTAFLRANEQYFWGDEILVAPVVDKGATSKRIYLPAGNWFNYFTQQVLPGHQWIEQKLAPDYIPAFVRAGSFIPTIEIKNNTTEYNISPLTITYFAANQPSSYELYEDDGESKNAIATKAFELTTFASSGATDAGLTINISSNGGHYKGQPTHRTVKFSIVGLQNKAYKVFVNDKLISTEEPGAAPIADNEVNISFKIQWNGKPVKIQVRN